MRDFERRIKKIEEELNLGEADGSAWWENYRKQNPVSAMIHADYHLARLRELWEDPKYASMFKKGARCGSTTLTTSGCEERQEDQPN